jgi:hypothetical protein
MNVTVNDRVALLRAVRARVQPDPAWEAALEHVLALDQAERAHLAVMHEPHLSHVLAGRKTVESRFSRYRVAPFGQVGAGDLLLLKSLSGPIAGLALVAEVDSYRLDPAIWASIQERFASALCVDERFWEDRRDACYATLIRLAAATAIQPLAIEKRDRRPWVVLAPRSARVHQDELALLHGKPDKSERPRTPTVMHQAISHDRPTEAIGHRNSMAAATYDKPTQLWLLE